MTVVVVVGVVVVGVVVVTVTTPGELCDGEREARDQEQASDDKVFVSLDRAAELQADGDEDAAQQDRQQDVGDAGQQREPHDAARRVAARAREHCQRSPVIRQHRMTESDPGRRDDQRGRRRHPPIVSHTFTTAKVSR
ncbi:MAG TPA: hypothetical protein VHE83_16540 [Mycobacteriales bacterium]|nr:hypothetical protein [Mycobacteriales bacterium]